MADKTSDATSQSFPDFDTWVTEQGYTTGFPAKDYSQGEFPTFEQWKRDKGFPDELYPPGGLVAPEPESGEISKGLSRGLRQTGALFHGAGAAVGDLFGMEEYKQRRIDDYTRLMRDAEQYAPEIGSVEEIEGPGQLMSWAAGVLGEQLPNIVGFALSGGVGALIGKVGAKRLITKAVEDQLKKKVASWATRGALAGGYTFGTGLETGGIYGEQVEAGLPGSPGIALTGGALAGALELAPVVTVARMLGLGPAFRTKIMQKVSSLPIARRMLLSGAIVGGQESGTELAQELIALTARELVDENYEALGEEGRSRMLNSFAAGGVVGTFFGGLGGIRRHAYIGEVEDESLNRGEEVTLALPPPQPKLTGPAAVQEIPDLVFSEKSPHTEIYLIGDKGIENASQQKQDVITDIAVSKRPDELTPITTAIRAADSVNEGTALITPTTQERKGTLYANIPTKGPARRYGKSLQQLLDSYNKVLADPKSYTSEAQFVFDGKKTVAAKRRLTALEKAIKSTSDRANIPVQGFEIAPEIAPVGVSQPSSEVEIRDETKDEVAATIPGYNTLNPAQQKRVNDLLMKDKVEGLNEREVATLEKLTTRAEMQSRGVQEQDLRTAAKDKEALAETAKQVEADETVRSSLKPPENMTGISREEVINAVRAFVSELRIRPKIRVVNSLELADTEFADQASRSGALYIKKGGEEVVYLIEDNIPNVDAAIKHVMHEVLAHYGLRAMFSPKEMEQVLDWIHRTKHGSREYAAIEREYAALYNNQRALGQLQGMTFNQLVAEEYIANIAETGTNMPLLKRIIAKIKQWLRTHTPKFLADKVSFTDNDIRSMLKDIRMFLRGRVINNNQAPKYAGRDGVVRSSLAATNATTISGELGMEDSEIADAINNLGSIWGIKFKKLFLTPLQMAEQYGLEPVKKYVNEVQRWWTTKAEIVSPADILVQDWWKLGADSGRKISRALFEISIMSDENNRRIDGAELIDMLTKEYRMNQEEIEIYLRIDGSLVELAARLESGLKYNAARESLGIDPTEFLDAWNSAASFEEKQAIVENFASTGLGDINLLKRMTEIENQMRALKNRNYFPRMRFGHWTVAVRAKRGQTVEYEGETFSDGQLVIFETFESQSAAKVGRDILAKEFSGPNTYIQESKLSDEEFTFLGLPPAMFDMIETELMLSPEQKEALKDIYLRMSPGRSFLKHLRQRKGIAGYSEDAMRVYATYMMSAANNLARVEHHLDMQAPLQELGEMRKRYGELVPNNRTLVELTEYFQQHYKYLMNPKNDWAKLRAYGFLWYLGANPKSALVNATQIPMVSYPYLATIYGDSASVSHLSAAYKHVAQMLRGKGVGVINVEEDKMFNGLLHEMIIDESQVTELAGISEAPTLFRVMPEQADTRLLNKVSYYAGYMFRQVEKYNRRVVALAAFRLARENGDTYNDAYQAAKKAVQTTQYEYAKWNRPVFMRGKRSVMFLFWQYMQHTTYLMAGGQGQQTAMRMWMMMLMAAGLMGLPFAENLIDLLDFSGTKMKQALGMKNPKVELRDDLRELLLNITDRPDIFMHGLGRNYGLGALHVLEALGVPIPNVDISGSLSLGRTLPGLEEATRETRNPDEKFGAVMIDIMGPVAAMGYNLWKMVESNDPDTWKKYERGLPIAMKNVSKAIRLHSREQETLRGGIPFVEFDPSNPDEMAEIVAQSLGFTPSRLSAKYELRASQEEARRYWLTRRATIMQIYGYAATTKNREGIADAKKAVRVFNNSVPDARLRIRQKDITKSLKQRRHRKQQIEAGRPIEKRMRGLFDEKKALFPEVEE